MTRRKRIKRIKKYFCNINCWQKIQGEEFLNKFRRNYFYAKLKIWKKIKSFQKLVSIP
jgi:hypothetical protein